MEPHRQECKLPSEDMSKLRINPRHNVLKSQNKYKKSNRYQRGGGERQISYKETTVPVMISHWQ